MSLAPGIKLGPYEIVAPLGAGGMGEVYRARDTVLKREVAVKVLPDSYSSDPERLRRFQQEAEAAATLNHPNILTVHHVGQQDGISYLVTELLQGDTLREKLRGGPLPVRTAIDYAVQIARGLATAHEKGIVQRDLKPENLFVTRDGRIKILDFGLAKLTQPQPNSVASMPTASQETTPGAVMGTVGYMSPEQVRGQVADPRSDIFAFGAVLFEMLTGNRAFHGTDLCRHHERHPEPGPSHFPTDCEPASRSATDHQPLLAEKPGAAFPFGRGLGIRHRGFDRCAQRHPTRRSRSRFAGAPLDNMVGCCGSGSCCGVNRLVSAPVLLGHRLEIKPTFVGCTGSY
jgi:serine/threonine protein kinase